MSNQWKEESPTDSQLRRLAALDLLEDRSYTKGEASNLLNDAEKQRRQPDWKLADNNSTLVRSALKKSLQAVVRRIKKEIADREAKESAEIDQSEALDLLTEYEEALNECIEDDRLEKEDAKEERRASREDRDSVIDVIQHEFGSEGEFGDAFRRPTKKQIEVCLAELDKRQPDWQAIDFYPSSNAIANLLAEKFPELLKTQPKIRVTPPKKSSLSLFVPLLLTAIGITVFCIWKAKSGAVQIQTSKALAAIQSITNPSQDSVTVTQEVNPDPGPLVPMKTWTHRDGRKLEAALVSVAKNAEGKYEGTFMRANGETFAFLVGSLSDDDVSVVKTQMQKRGLLTP